MAVYTDAVSELYARSLFELADSAGGTEKATEIADELEQICEIARGDARFHEFLSSPVIDSSRRATSLQSIFAGRVTDLTLRFLLVLNDKDRLGELESITVAFDQLVHEATGRIEVDVWTGGPLDDDKAEMIRGRIGQALGKDPVLHRYVDASMIGGIRVQVGDRLYDGSVATRLRRLREQILAGGTTAIRGDSDRFMDRD